MAPGNRNQPTKKACSTSTYTIMAFFQDFPDDAACLVYLWKRHYALDEDNRAHCPKCGEIRKFHRTASRPSYSCDSCGHHIHPTAGTIFHKSSTSLQLWFHAIFLMTQTKCGISAKQLERDLGVTYKTAWRMFTKIRNELMAPDDTTLGKRVEMDETYVGGKPRNSDKAKFSEDPAGRQSAAIKWSHSKKTPIFGMVERNSHILRDGKTKMEVTRYGKVVAYVVPKQPQAAIMEHIANHVDDEAVVYTDDARIYDRLEGDGFTHHKINHSKGVYVDGHVHTQQIEGFWAMVKNAVIGVHHGVSTKYLQGYVNEYAWRYNRRGETSPMFYSLLEQVRPA
jgi:transposase-like protein